jgi:hypothetical protein
LAAIRRATWAAYATFVIPAPALLLTAPATPLADIIGFCAAVPMLAAVPALVNVRPQGSKTVVMVGMGGRTSIDQRIRLGAEGCYVRLSLT